MTKWPGEKNEEETGPVIMETYDPYKAELEMKVKNLLKEVEHQKMKMAVMAADHRAEIEEYGDQPKTVEERLDELEEEVKYLGNVVENLVEERHPKS